MSDDRSDVSGVISDNRPDVSVVIPVYNAEQYLADTLNSVLNQSDIALEVICVDDGSTDASGRLIRELAQNDERIRYLPQENQGPGAARNYGIRVASGKYIVFIDADDNWQGDQLAKLFQIAQVNNLQLLTFGIEGFIDGTATNRKTALLKTYRPRKDIQTTKPGTEILATWVKTRDYQASPCLYLVNLSWLKREHIQFTTGYYHEDNAFTFALLMRAQRIRCLALPFYQRRIRDASIMTSQSALSSFLGYFVAYLDMVAEFQQLDKASKHYDAVELYLENYYHMINRTFRQLEPEQQVEVVQQMASRTGGAELLLKLLKSPHSPPDPNLIPPIRAQLRRRAWIRFGRPLYPTYRKYVAPFFGAH